MGREFGSLMVTLVNCQCSSADQLKSFKSNTEEKEKKKRKKSEKEEKKEKKQGGEIHDKV